LSRHAGRLIGSNLCRRRNDGPGTGPVGGDQGCDSRAEPFHRIKPKLGTGQWVQAIHVAIDRHDQQVGFEQQAHKASALRCPPLPDALTGVAMKRGDAAVESRENKFGDIHKRYATRLGVLPFLGNQAGPAKRNVKARESQDFTVHGMPPFPHLHSGILNLRAIHHAVRHLSDGLPTDKPNSPT
jgi:hypothetical protein